MNLLHKLCREKRVSQRTMASLAGVSFRTIQLIWSGEHDPKVSTLQKVATALGYPKGILTRTLAHIFAQPIDSIAMVSQRLLEEGEDAWKIWLFNFVDAFRRRKDTAFVDVPPAPELSKRTRALIASVVDTLCEELGVAVPDWCASVPPLKEPWFVAEVENLKATALLESPVHFRKRNIFVLGNFLSRA